MRDHRPSRASFASVKPWGSTAEALFGTGFKSLGSALWFACSARLLQGSLFAPFQSRVHIMNPPSCLGTSDRLHVSALVRGGSSPPAAT